MTWLVLGALAVAGFLVFALIGAAFSLVLFLVTLPFRLIGFLIRIPLLFFGFLVCALVLSVLVFLPLAVLLAPAAVLALLAIGLWRWAHRSDRKAIPA